MSWIQKTTTFSVAGSFHSVVSGRFLKMKTSSFSYFCWWFYRKTICSIAENLPFLLWWVLVWSYQFLWSLGSFWEVLFCQRRFNPSILTWIKPCELWSCIIPMKMSVADENGGTIIQVIYENTISIDSISMKSLVEWGFPFHGYEAHTISMTEDSDFIPTK